jgi:nitroreductase
MEIIEAIKTRRSVRTFKPEPVSLDTVKRLIEAASWAPSACNIQGWRFIIINEPKLKEEIVDQGGAVIIKSAPTGILVVYDNRTANLEYQDYIQSGAAAVQNLLLAAHSFGLGSCWVCHLPPKKKLRKILKIPNNFSPLAYILLGYKEKEPIEVSRKHPLNSLISYNIFNFEKPKREAGRLKLFLFRILIKIYYCLPLFLKKKFVNKFIDQKFVKKFEN